MLGWLLDALGWSRFAQLCRQSQSADTAQRAHAAAAFAELPEPRVAAWLLNLLADVEPSVRAAASQTLHSFGPLATPSLLAGLNDAREQVAVLSAELLGKSKPPEAAEALLRALKYAPRPVQLAARRALESLGPIAVPLLESARDEPQPWVNRQIHEALDAIARTTP